MRKWIISLDKYINGGDISAQNFVNVYQNEADNLMKEIILENNENVQNKYSIVSKYMGHRIDKKIVPILEFFSHIALMENEYAEIKKQK